MLAASLPTVAGNAPDLRQWLAGDDVPIVAGRPLLAPVEVRQFYARRDYRPAWHDEHTAQALLSALYDAEAEGLRPADYHLETLLWLLAPIRELDAWSRMELELLLTDAFFALALDSAYGRPSMQEPGWLVQAPQRDLIAALERALLRRDPAAALRELLPTDPGYRQLREMRDLYRRLAAVGGWPTLPDGPLLQLGVRDDRVPLLRARLQLSGDYSATAGGNPLEFDDALAAALRRFQRRHGLEPDGRAGPATVAALNVSVEERLRQIELNLERWRRLPRDFGERHVMVNIADYSLEVIEHGEAVFKQRVIVGSQRRRTPVMSGRISYLVLNPSWEVPNSIMVEDMLPRVRANPNFFERNGIEVLQGWAQERRIDPQAVDWTQVPTDPFPYRFRQAPGPHNALGQIKFMFPNQQSIYLHDTPNRGLFARQDRALSSGCVRVEQAVALASYLLGWDDDELRRALKAGQERSIYLSQPVPVHLLYWTAWVDRDGELQFRNDIYAGDAHLLAALEHATGSVASAVSMPLLPAVPES